MEKLGTWLVGAALALVALVKLLEAAFGAYGLGVQLLVWSPLAIFLAIKHRTLIRWWYHLTPHPAAERVRRAIHEGEPLDGERFAALVRAGGAGSTIEQQVRNAQAHALAEEWRTHEAELRASEAKLWEEERVRLARDAEATEAQTALVAAALAHEQAAARVAALQQARS